MRKFSEIIGQNAIIDHLQNALRTGSISHAYMISGDAGSGRGTIASIFAAAMQCGDLQEEQCGDLREEQCGDLQEEQYGDRQEEPGGTAGDRSQGSGMGAPARIRPRLLEPCGKGNEKPVFAEKNVYCDHVRLFGVRHNLLKMRVRSMTSSGDADPGRIGFQPAAAGPAHDAVCFRDADELAARIAESPELSIVYEPQINEYMGQRRIQILIRHYE